MNVFIKICNKHKNLFDIIITIYKNLIFPLNSFHPNNFTKVNNFKNFNNEDFLNYWLPNEMHTYIYIVSPPNKVYTLLYSEDIFYMDNSICNLPSKYDNELSSTFSPTSNYIIYFSGFSICVLQIKLFPHILILI